MSEESTNTGHQAVFGQDIPATTPVVDVGLRLQIPQAPPIRAGDPCSLTDVTNVLRESRAREFQKNYLPGLARVNSEEVAESRLRETKVLQAVTMGGQGGNQSGLGDASFQRRLLERLDAIDRNLDEFKGEVNGKLDEFKGEMNEFKGEVNGKLEESNLRLHNMEALQKNASACLPHHRLFPFKKRHPGRLQDASFGPGVRAPRSGVVGELYPDEMFPKTVSALWEMQKEEIISLAKWANETFEILPTDDLATCRRKFLAFVTGKQV